MAKRPILDLVPRNPQFHNFTTMELTAKQAKLLGLGLKFRPTLRPPPIEQVNDQIQDFCRSVRLHRRFINEPKDPGFNPRLYVKSGWKPPREDPDLEDNLYRLSREIRANFTAAKPKWKHNLSREDRAELAQLRDNELVRVLNTDKNLGPTLMATEWVRTETMKHLNDPNSYTVVGREDWTVRWQEVIDQRDNLISTYSNFINTNVDTYLHSFDTDPSSLNPAKFYIIPKIHKSPIASRPIAASYSYITRPISVFVDEMAKPVIRMPTVLKDSGELIQILESLELPSTEVFLVTADITALYPNIDIKKALIALDLLLREAHSPLTPLLVQFARIVLENNFLISEFCPNIRHQNYGLAMGSPFAVTIANAFMYYLEKEIIHAYSRHLALYKCFIDDIFAIWMGPRDLLEEFIMQLNSQDERIKLTYEISNTSISFLDLFIYKEAGSNKLQFSTFQKPLNKYLYIPFESFHPASNKKAFIRGELMRYTRNSSNFYSFSHTRELFWRRLHLRGYPGGFLLAIFNSIKYSCRRKWLVRQKPKSVSRKLVVFKTTYNCSYAGIRKIISKYLPDLNAVVCYKATATLWNLCK